MGSRRRIIDDELFAHFVTFSVYRRRRLLDHDHPKRIVLGVLNYVLEKHAARCIGFVIMPDHVHALVWFPKTGQLSPFMHEWKRQSSLRIRGWYRKKAPNYAADFGEGKRFWQAKYYPFEIYSRKKIEEKLTYMHLNPVRAGLVERAIDWPWSSARWYERGQSVGVPIQWIE
jgi:putative transposase